MRFRSWGMGLAAASCALLSGCPEGGAFTVGTETCLGCHDGFSARDQREFLDSPHHLAGVSCEDCHGPGLAHVRNAGRGGLFIGNPARGGFRNSYASCVACHATTVTQFLRSAHATAEAATCHTCHTLHRANSEFVPSRDNRLCLLCHGRTEFEARTAVFLTDAALREHSRHSNDPAGTGASRCTACHMNPVNRFGQRSGLNYHDMVPRPPITSNLAAEAGTMPIPPNTCAGITGCHDGSVPRTPVFDVDDLEQNANLQVLYEIRHGESMGAALIRAFIREDGA